MEDNQKIVEDMQAVAAQMVQDDIEENPDIVMNILTVLPAVKINVWQEVFNIVNTDSAMIVLCLLKLVLN